MHFRILPLVIVTSSCAHLLGATPLARAQASAPSGTTMHEIRVGREKRSFLLHQPAHAASPTLPVIIALHGSSANPRVIRKESGLDAIADSVGALVVYPFGTGGIPYLRLFWNNGPAAHPDESAMIRAIVDSLALVLPVDRSRVGVIGFSDGATLAYRIACADSAGVSAIGVVAGEMVGCTPHPAVSTIVFHGTADDNIHFGDTRDDVAGWAAREGCGAARTDSTARFVRDRYGDCGGGAEVVLYAITGGEHGWPGGARSWFLAPKPPAGVDASRLFADFVITHPRATPR